MRNNKIHESADISRLIDHPMFRRTRDGIVVSARKRNVICGSEARLIANHERRGLDVASERGSVFVFGNFVVV